MLSAVVSTSPKYLSVACALGCLTEDEARQVLRVQRQINIPGLRVGQIAVAHHYFNEDEAERVEAEKDRYTGKVVPDPEVVRRGVGWMTAVAKWQTVIEAAANAGVLVIALLTTGDVALSVRACSIAATFTKLLGALTQLRAGVRPTVVRFLEILPWLAAFALLALLSYRIQSLQATGVDGDWLWSLVLAALLVTLALPLLVAWKDRRLRHVLARHDGTCLLVSRAAQASKRLGSDEQARRSEILKSTATLLGLNPWERIVSRLGAVVPKLQINTVLMYLVPDAAGGNLKIDVWDAGRAPDSCQAALAVMQQHYRASVFDKEWYEKAAKALTDEGVLNKKRFRDQLERPRRVSLAGFVYATGKATHEVGVDDWHFYDGSHVEVIRQNGKDLPTGWERCMDFVSVSAFPVYRKTDAGAVRVGVLFAAKNVPNGITPEDRFTLMTAANLLGLE